MLKRRIIACLVVKSGIVVQSIGFNKYLPVGKPEIAIDFLSQWGIDEIVLLDIDATRRANLVSSDMIRLSAENAFVPLTVGGGIKTVNDIQDLLEAGADKVCINNALYMDSSLISKGAEQYGNQCIVASIDVKKDLVDNSYKVYSYIDRKTIEVDPIELASRYGALGAGEIFLNMVDKDGIKSGFDIDYIKKFSDACDVPVIACGGAGRPQHLHEVLDATSVSAVAAANYFHFYEHSVIVSKGMLKNNNNKIRLDTASHYTDISFSDGGRPLKKRDDELESLMYKRIECETL